MKVPVKCNLVLKQSLLAKVKISLNTTMVNYKVT